MHTKLQENRNIVKDLYTWANYLDYQSKPFCELVIKKTKQLNKAKQESKNIYFLEKELLAARMMLEAVDEFIAAMFDGYIALSEAYLNEKRRADKIEYAGKTAFRDACLLADSTKHWHRKYFELVKEKEVCNV